MYIRITFFLPNRQVYTRAQLRDPRLLCQLEFPGEDIAHQHVCDQPGVGLRRPRRSRRDAARMPAEKAQPGNQASRGYRSRNRYVTAIIFLDLILYKFHKNFKLIQ